MKLPVMQSTKDISLPRELWQLIGSYLGNADLWDLSVCSKKLFAFLIERKWLGRVWACSRWSRLPSSSSSSSQIHTTTNIRVKIYNTEFYPSLFLNHLILQHVHTLDLAHVKVTDASLLGQTTTLNLSLDWCDRCWSIGRSYYS